MSRRPLGVPLWPAVVAGLLATVVVVLGWRGSDWPAQLYRADLFDRAGFTQWDNQWYGGHPTPGYSILFPPLGALVGVPAVAVAASFAATWMFAKLAGSLFSPRAARVAALWFAIGSTTNVAVGRVTFALGLSFALAAALAMLRKSWWALLLAVAAPLASPVAGVFVAIAASATWFANRRADERKLPRLAMAMTVGALAPIGILSVVFPEGGRFPFRFGHFVGVIAACAIVAFIAPRNWDALRIGAAALRISRSDVVRRTQPGRWQSHAVGHAPGWTSGGGHLVAPAQGVAHRAGVTHARVAVATRIRRGVHCRSRPVGARGVLPPTTRFSRSTTRGAHRNTVHETALGIALRGAPRPARRGWQRQLDIEFNSLFYEPGALTESSYREWLATNAITYVALPDAALDESAVEEAAILRAGVAGLRPVWSNEHWQVWQVTDAEPLVDGAARLERLEPDEFTLDVDKPGDVLVRIRYSPHWDIDGPGCLVESPDGWTQLHSPRSGSVRVRQVVTPWVPFGVEHPDECPSPPED